MHTVIMMVAPMDHMQQPNLLYTTEPSQDNESVKIIGHSQKFQLCNFEILLLGPLAKT